MIKLVIRVVSHQTVVAAMNGAVGSDVYSVVDLSKKKNRREATQELASVSDGNTYDIVRKDNFDYNEVREETPSKPLKYSTHENTFSANGLKFVIALIITWIVLVALVILNIVLFVRISSQDAVIDASDKDRQIQTNMSATNMSPTNMSTVQDTSSQDSLSRLGNSINSSISDIYEILNNVNGNLSSLHTNFQADRYLSSCSDILQQDSTNPSGRYIVRSSNGVLRSVYCDMTNTFGGDSIGWMRVAKLDVNNCPMGLETQNFSGNITTCVQSTYSGKCSEIIYSVNNIQYSKVTGRVRGYQIGTPDGFTRITTRTTVNYVDGIRILNTDNEHIWTFAAGCDCNSRKPPFIDSDYSCDRHAGCRVRRFCNTLLWNSQRCGEPSTPWFLKTLNPTTANIQVGICRDDNSNDENLAITQIELYVQ